MRALGAAILLVIASCGRTEGPTIEVAGPPPATREAPNPLVVTDSLSGTVRLQGKVRGPHGLAIDPPQACARHKASREMRESLMVGPDGALANVFVNVSRGLPASTKPEVPRAPVTLIQWCILFQPRVFAVHAGQPLVIENGEGVNHNVRAAPRTNPKVNRGMQPGERYTHVFERPEAPIRLVCDVHPWEVAWAHVVDHPYWAITGTDGRYAIPNVPPGEYEVTAWHGRFGESRLKAKVRIQAGPPQPLDFTFESDGK